MKVRKIGIALGLLGFSMGFCTLLAQELNEFVEDKYCPRSDIVEQKCEDNFARFATSTAESASSTATPLTLELEPLSGEGSYWRRK